MNNAEMTCEQLQAELEAIKAGIDGLEDDQEIMDEIGLKISGIIASQRALFVLAMVGDNVGLLKFDRGKYGIIQMAAGYEPETVEDVRAFLEVFAKIDEFNNKAKKLEADAKELWKIEG